MLLGFKDVMERSYSEKTLNFEHKRNAEKIMNIKQNKFSGIFTSQPEVAKVVQERITYLQIDDLETRRNFSIHLLAEETQLVFLFTGKQLLKIVWISNNPI